MVGVVAKKYVEVIFRDTHDNQEWTCEYCKQVATTIRHGVAVCPQHKHLWTVGAEPSSIVPAPPEASPNH